jgi:hypothetical protein
MQEILFDYKLNPTTWAYISALMMVGTYFKFHRFWSVRNLDLVGLIASSPALLLVYYGLLKKNDDLLQAGYIWLFLISIFFLVRMLLDVLMVRRPLLDPNLSASGLAFTGASLLVFLMANVITSPPDRLERMMATQATPAVPNPGYALFAKLSNYSNPESIAAHRSRPEVNRQLAIRLAVSRTVTILAHLGVVLGMVWVGFRHFGNIHTGVAAATLYLLTFYTSQFTSQMDHVAPAVLLVWAIVFYRRPILAGMFLGLAGGLSYYPLFLLPLWCSFYWRRGLFRFIFGVALSLGILTGALALNANDSTVLVAQLKQMFGWRDPLTTTASGFWDYYDQNARIPLLALFVALSLGLALWPAQKNLGTLLSCSAAVMIATQFWHANHGGLYMGWYLPLLILTVFRPNLEDRVALSAVQPFWRRKPA